MRLRGTLLIVAQDDTDHDAPPAGCDRPELGPRESATIAAVRRLALMEWLLYSGTID